jgi:hypothetical protein
MNRLVTMSDGKQQATGMLDGIATAVPDCVAFSRAYINAACGPIVSGLRGCRISGNGVSMPQRT